jgi:hypothetical protein
MFVMFSVEEFFVEVQKSLSIMIQRSGGSSSLSVDEWVLTYSQKTLLDIAFNSFFVGHV